MLNETWTNDMYNIDIPGYSHIAIHREIKKLENVEESGVLVVYDKTNLSKGIKIVSHYEDH